MLFRSTSQIKSDDARPAPPDLVFRNAAPIVVELSNGRAAVRSLQIAGKNTSLGISGSFAPQSIDLKVEGSADLQTFSLLDPNVTSSGVSTVSAWHYLAVSHHGHHGNNIWSDVDATY